MNGLVEFAYFRDVILKLKLFNDAASFADFYFKEEFDYDPEAVLKDFVPENKPRLSKLREALAGLEPFGWEAIQKTFNETAAALGVKAGILVHPARLACTGKKVGPSLYHLMEVLGKERVLARLDRALGRIA